MQSSSVSSGSIYISDCAPHILQDDEEEEMDSGEDALALRGQVMAEGLKENREEQDSTMINRQGGVPNRQPVTEDELDGQHEIDMQPRGERKANQVAIEHA